MAAEQEYEVLEQKADSNDGEEEVEKEPLFITNPIYEWVPPQVLGTGWIVMEPPWHKIKKMDFLTFYTGIQSRNWTSQFYDENAMPWKVAFYKVRLLLYSDETTTSAIYNDVGVMCMQQSQATDTG